MGKSTLWQQWSSGVRTVGGAPVILATRCLNTTQGLPFDPMRRLLGSMPCREQWGQMATALLPIWQAELLRLAPTLAPPGATVTVPMQTTPTEERGLIDEALAQFLRAWHGDPLVLFVDDLHWADSATLDWLLYLTDRMAGEPLLLVAACRPTEMSAQLSRLLLQWQREDVLVRIDLPRLTEAETAKLLTALGTAPTVVPYLYTQSGGNPYYLTQLSDVAVDGIPASLADLVRARLHYLDEQWQPILQAAAILEPTIDLGLLSATSGHSEEETVDAVDGLLAAAILSEQGEEYAFVHPLLATVLRDDLSSGRRKLLHRRAAAGLLARSGPQENEIAGPLAHHFAAAGETERAAHFATVAGAAALRIGAADEAVGFYRQAVDLAPTPERLLGLGQARLLQPGQIEAARQLMIEALTAYEQAGDGHGTIRAGLHLAGSYLGTQEGAQVLYWARRVLPDLEVVDDPLLHASAHWLMGTAQFRNGYALHEAEAHFAAAIDLVTTAALDTEIALMSSFEWGNLALERGEYGAAISRFQQARGLADARQNLLFAVLSRNNLAYALLNGGDIPAAQHTIEEALGQAATYALRSAQYYLLSTSGEIALVTGALDQATAAFQQALELAQKYDNLTFVANLWAHQGRVAHARGDLAGARTLLEKARAAVTDAQAAYLQTQIDLWLTAVALDQHDHAAAAHYLHAANSRLSTAEYNALKMYARQLHALLLAE
jgi:tetratricopeptide (TPR) repeat protein